MACRETHTRHKLLEGGPGDKGTQWGRGRERETGVERMEEKWGEGSQMPYPHRKRAEEKAGSGEEEEGELRNIYDVWRKLTWGSGWH